MFSFGQGLSYTTFEYGKIATDKKEMTLSDTITFTVNIKNTGERKGAEIVQLYIRDLESSLPRPEKELKGFKRISLQPGETRAVSFEIDKSFLSFFDDGKHNWVAEPGDFEALIGASSSDLKSKVGFTLK